MPKRVLILFAHPAYEKSRVHEHLVSAARAIEGVTLHDLYEVYPDLDLDIAREQALLLALGLTHVYRESVDGAMRLGADALRLLGHRAHRSWRFAQAFRRRDEANLHRLAALFRDQSAHLSAAREAIRDLEASLRTDQEAAAASDDSAWDAESLRREFRRAGRSLAQDDASP